MAPAPTRPSDDRAYLDASSVGNLVHALEHGRAVIWLAPSAPHALRGDIKALFDEDDHHLLLEPGMRYALATSAWGTSSAVRSRTTACPSGARVRDEYRDKGPESVP